MQTQSPIDTVPFDVRSSARGHTKQDDTHTQAGPVLSFGVPVRNGARFLRRLLESLRAQDFDDFEVVVCDNQSTDATGDIAREFASCDPRFKYHLNETDIGQIENFNLVFERSSGRYFRWIGSDDWLEPSYASRCVEALEANPDAVGVTTLWKYIDDEGQEEFIEYSGRRVDSKYLLPRMSRMLLALQATLGMDPIYSALRSNMLKESGMLPIGLWTDRALSLRLAIMGPFVHVHECLAYRRNSREPEKILVARYHPSIKEAERATDVRVAPRWTMYRDLAKAVRDSPLGPGQQVVGTGMVVFYGGMHHVRALYGRAVRLVERTRKAATTV